MDKNEERSSYSELTTQEKRMYQRLQQQGYFSSERETISVVVNDKSNECTSCEKLKECILESNPRKRDVKSK